MDPTTEPVADTPQNEVEQQGDKGREDATDVPSDPKATEATSVSSASG